MKSMVVYIHGQGGNAGEAEHYRPLFAGSEIVGLDYTAQTPWEAKEEFPGLFEKLTGQADSVTVIANSIGAYFAMSALEGQKLERACFISPVVDMGRLIADMMVWAGVTEDELREKGEIATAFGQTLSWAYLTYVREHPIRWTVPTRILYGGRDNLTSRQTISDFARKIGADLTVMEDGEHWFHTQEQMQFLDAWIMGSAPKHSIEMRRVKMGDERSLAYIQTESWKNAFSSILDRETLERCTEFAKAEEMYRHLLENQIGNGYLLLVAGKPHCIAWWDAARDKAFSGKAELICIHSLPNNWRRGYGSIMMDKILTDIRRAGYAEVILWVFRDNKRARAFYESKGFVLTEYSQQAFGTEELCYRKVL